MKVPIFFGTYSANTQNQVQYLPIAYSPRGASPYVTGDDSDPSNQNQGGAIMFPMTGTLKNLYIYIAADNATIGTYLFTIMKNGIATTLLCSAIPTGSGLSVLLSDTTHSIAVVAGDLFTLQVSTLLCDAGFGNIACAMEFDPS